MFQQMNIDIILTNEELYESKDGTTNVPQFATEGSVAVDLRANIADDIILQPGQCEKIGTGLRVDMSNHECMYEDEHGKQFRFALPNGLALAATILPRSGLGHKGLVCGNLVGLIDMDYQGEMTVSAWNRSSQPITIPAGERFAQLMFVLAVIPNFNVVTEFRSVTERGENGYGHSGTK